MARIVSSFLAGLVFGVGLWVSQMTNPNKVLSFLDFFGEWDPSLALVMGAALAVDVVLFRVILKRPRPHLDVRFHLPVLSAIDARLVGGAALFGIGWGLAGFCPGGAIAAASGGLAQAGIFCTAMIAGMLLYRAIFQQRSDHAPDESAAPAI